MKEYKRNIYRIFVWKHEGYRPLRRPRLRRESNIKMKLRNMGWGDMD